MPTLFCAFKKTALVNLKVSYQNNLHGNGNTLRWEWPNYNILLQWPFGLGKHTVNRNKKSAKQSFISENLASAQNLHAKPSISETPKQTKKSAHKTFQIRKEVENNDKSVLKKANLQLESIGFNSGTKAKYANLLQILWNCLGDYFGWFIHYLTLFFCRLYSKPLSFLPYFSCNFFTSEINGTGNPPYMLFPQAGGSTCL